MTWLDGLQIVAGLGAIAAMNVGLDRFDRWRDRRRWKAWDARSAAYWAAQDERRRELERLPRMGTGRWAWDADGREVE